jgi:hypothetical protein
LNVDQTPIVFSGERVHEPVPQKAPVIRVFQIFDLGRPSAHPLRRDEKLDGAPILLAALDQQLLLLPLRLERHPWNLHIQRECDQRRHQEHQQQRESGLASPVPHPGLPVPHPGVLPVPHPGVPPAHQLGWSSVNGSDCCRFDSVSSISTEFTPMRTTR